MLIRVVRRTRKALGAMRSHPITTELAVRERLAFTVLHPQVEVAKRSTSVRIVAGTIFTASILTGNWGTTAAIAGCWVGTRPLVHVAAGGVACVGAVDARLLAAIRQLQQAEPAAMSVTW